MSDLQKPPKVTRREALRTTGRWVILGATAATLGALVTRRGEACDRAGLCQGCAALSGCGLPPAVTARRENRRK